MMAVETHTLQGYILAQTFTEIVTNVAKVRLLIPSEISELHSMQTNK
jgi:hypothetical protein